jgi:hypothetical protein
MYGKLGGRYARRNDIYISFKIDDYIYIINFMKIKISNSHQKSDPKLNATHFAKLYITYML